MARISTPSARALAAIILIGGVAGGSGCGSGQSWYSSYANNSWNPRPAQRHGGSGGFSGFGGSGGGGAEELLWFGAFMLVWGAIELGEYCIETCEGWFE